MGRRNKLSKCGMPKPEKKYKRPIDFFSLFLSTSFRLVDRGGEGGGDRAGAPAIFLLFACRFFFLSCQCVCVCIRGVPFTGFII